MLRSYYDNPPSHRRNAQEDPPRIPRVPRHPNYLSPPPSAPLRTRVTDLIPRMLPPRTSSTSSSRAYSTATTHQKPPTIDISDAIALGEIKNIEAYVKTGGDLTKIFLHLPLPNHNDSKKFLVVHVKKIIKEHLTPANVKKLENPIEVLQAAMRFGYCEITQTLFSEVERLPNFDRVSFARETLRIGAYSPKSKIRIDELGAILAQKKLNQYFKEEFESGKLQNATELLQVLGADPAQAISEILYLDKGNLHKFLLAFADSQSIQRILSAAAKADNQELLEKCIATLTSSRTPKHTILSTLSRSIKKTADTFVVEMLVKALSDPSLWTSKMPLTYDYTQACNALAEATRSIEYSECHAICLEERAYRHETEKKYQEACDERLLPIKTAHKQTLRSWIEKIRKAYIKGKQDSQTLKS